VLVDEARTPLIISGAESSEESERATCQIALDLASEMFEGRHYSIERHEHTITFWILDSTTSSAQPQN